MTTDDDIWDSPFHGTAWAAYLEVWRATGQFPPDSETTRRLAFQFYEEALAEKNRRKGSDGCPPPREAGQECEAKAGNGHPRVRAG